MSWQPGVKIDDWDVAYSNRGAVADAAQWLERAAGLSRDFLSSFAGDAELDIVYGPDPRHRYDILGPRDALGTLIFIHGGYWRSLTKEEHYHFCAGALAAGWRVALPEYPLCPAVTVSAISQAMVEATRAILQRVPAGPVVLSGHSAGGQLATYVASAASGLGDDARARIARVVSLSGLHDLRPLLRTTDLNGTLKLDTRQAEALSPALSAPGHDFELACICGGAELPEFLRQNDLLANIWSGLGIATSVIEAEGRNHFTLLDLMREDTAVTRALTLR